MTTLDETKTKLNGHAEPVTRAWDARLARIEQRLDEVAESGEQRVLVLRDATAGFAAAELAQRDEEIAILKKHVADLEQKFERQAAIDQRVNEISARLEERQARRDRGKNGITDGNFIHTMNMVIAQERQSARTEFKAAVEEAQRAVEAKLAALEQRIIQHIEQSSGRTDALGEAIATERAGRQKEVRGAVEEAQRAFDEAQRAVDVKLEALEQRLKAVPGKLPVAKVWHPESVTYQAEFVCHDGALWQARKDTAQAPGDADWVCVARAGRDAVTPNVRGTFSVDETYKQLDVVVSHDAAFIAKHDNPGICPGDGWQLLSRPGTPGRKGETGERGMRGERGEKGETGPSIVSWQVDRERYRASPLMSDGTVGPNLELRGIFEQFQVETS